MSFFWKPYVPVAQRRAAAAKQMAKLAKSGHPVSPVNIAGRTIASTFWGKAWCENLEAYSDFENRLPRGRTYVRNGSVVDLQIDKGKVTARVSGSSLYSNRHQNQAPGHRPLETNPKRVRRKNRFHRRTASRTPLLGGHGNRQQPAERTLSKTGGNLDGLFLPRLGGPLQTPCRHALRSGRPPG
jgi:hypothetical protein